MQTLLYNGSWSHFLCAVFDAYEYRLPEVEIIPMHHFHGNMFAEPLEARDIPDHAERVWRGLQKKLSPASLDHVYRSFLSEIKGIENSLLSYIRYGLKSGAMIECDFSHSAVLSITQTSKKVYREKHRMEAFVRFQKTADGLYFAVIEPDFNVLPLIVKHFSSRYADQRWVIYDARRKYGIYYDTNEVSEVQIDFSDQVQQGRNLLNVYDESEAFYQVLWQQYFQSINIKARKNTRLHLQHMPARYWKYLTEKQHHPK